MELGFLAKLQLAATLLIWDEEEEEEEEEEDVSIDAIRLGDEL